MNPNQDACISRHPRPWLWRGRIGNCGAYEFFNFDYRYVHVACGHVVLATETANDPAPPALLADTVLISTAVRVGTFLCVTAPGWGLGGIDDS